MARRTDNPRKEQTQLASGPIGLDAQRGYTRPTAPPAPNNRMRRLWKPLLGVVVVIAAVTDWRTGKIKNWLTYPAIVAGFVLAMGFDKVGSIATIFSISGGVRVLTTLIIVPSLSRRLSAGR